MSASAQTVNVEQRRWQAEHLPFRVSHLAAKWLVLAPSLLLAAAIVPGVSLKGFGAAVLVAGVVAALNAVLPPLVAAVRLPFTLVTDFLLVLAVDAGAIVLASHVSGGRIEVDSIWGALAVAFVASAVSVALEVVLGLNDDDTYTLRVTRRIARRSGERVVSDEPGIVFLEIDGLALPVLQRAMRAGSAPRMAGWLADGGYRLREWETDLSSQTGASQAGILLGSNDDIPAFRWVEKERGRLMTCSTPADCAEIERRHLNGDGLLARGGASRGNLLSGGADHMILTVSRLDAERHANAGYRTFFANGYNATSTLVMFAWEVVLEKVAATRQRRRDVQPRGHRGGVYPLVRGALCVVVRDLIVSGVLTDMMKGRPAVYATFSSYDEVAHHSGGERPDTVEALRKLDQQFGRIADACRYAPRPYRIVVLSDHGQTQGATFKQRNGYGLEDLVRRSLAQGAVSTAGEGGGGDENHATLGHALVEATGRRSRAKKQPRDDVSEKDVVVLGSGNLGLVYLMDETHRLTLEEIDARHPSLVSTLREHPHIGWILVRSSADGPLVLGPRGSRRLADDGVDGEDPLDVFAPTAAAHLLRTDSFEHAPDLLIGSFYSPELETGCAFEELISFHGGLGGPQTRAFILAPGDLLFPEGEIIGAEQVHALLAGWRRSLQPDAAPAVQMV